MFTKQKVNIIRSKVWSIKELALKKSSLCVWELDSPKRLSPTLWGQDVKDGIPLPGDIPGIQKRLGHLFSCSQLLQNWLLMPPFHQIAELLYSDLVCEILVWPKYCHAFPEQFHHSSFHPQTGSNFFKFLLCSYRQWNLPKWAQDSSSWKKRNWEFIFKRLLVFSLF